MNNLLKIYFSNRVKGLQRLTREDFYENFKEFKQRVVFVDDQKNFYTVVNSKNASGDTWLKIYASDNKGAMYEVVGALNAKFHFSPMFVSRNLKHKKENEFVYKYMQNKFNARLATVDVTFS